MFFFFIIAPHITTKPERRCNLVVLVISESYGRRKCWKCKGVERARHAASALESDNVVFYVYTPVYAALQLVRPSVRSGL